MPSSLRILCSTELSRYPFQHQLRSMRASISLCQPSSVIFLSTTPTITAPQRRPQCFSAATTPAHLTHLRSTDSSHCLKTIANSELPSSRLHPPINLHIVIVSVRSTTTITFCILSPSSSLFLSHIPSSQFSFLITFHDFAIIPHLLPYPLFARFFCIYKNSYVICSSYYFSLFLFQSLFYHPFSLAIISIILLLHSPFSAIGHIVLFHNLFITLILPHIVIFTSRISLCLSLAILTFTLSTILTFFIFSFNCSPFIYFLLLYFAQITWPLVVTLT